MATTHAKILGSDEIKIYCPSVANGDHIIFPMGYMINKVLIKIITQAVAETDTITVYTGIVATVEILDTPGINEYVILNRSMFADPAKTAIFTSASIYTIVSTPATAYDVTYYLTKI
jgi:hypothetical protein